MTKVDEYKDSGGTGIILVGNGEVFAIDDSGIPDDIGKIERIVISIEKPEEMIGIYRIEHVMLYDENDEALYDDQDKVNNDEYHSEEELVTVLAKDYGVSTDIIDIS